MQFERLDKLLEDLTEVGPKGCGLSVYLHGKKLYEGYAGFADEESNTVMDKDVLLRFYSVTKVFTVTAALQLFEQGRFVLDDPIAEYIPEFENSKVCFVTGNGSKSLIPLERPVTIRDLMTMRSGLSYDGDGSVTELAAADLISEMESKGGFTTREFAKKLAGIPLEFQPGTHFHYSLSHDVIGALIEIVSGKKLGDYLRDNIFKPIGMNHTDFFIENIPDGNLATLYTWESKGKLVPTKEKDAQFHKAHMWESGGSGLISTIEDIAKFSSVMATGGSYEGTRILGRKTIDLMRANQLSGSSMDDFNRACKNGWEFLSGYGYGLGVRTLIDPAKCGFNGSEGEFGWGGMAGTLLLADPQEELAISYGHQILGNSIENNMEGYCVARVKTAVYSLLD